MLVCSLCPRCSRAAVIGLSSCDRDHTGCRAKGTYVCSIIEKVCQLLLHTRVPVRLVLLCAQVAVYVLLCVQVAMYVCVCVCLRAP